ncbi:MAG TPA: hypothetical protein VI318_25540 [Baekduia sp.]
MRFDRFGRLGSGGFLGRDRFGSEDFGSDGFGCEGFGCDGFGCGGGGDAGGGGAGGTAGVHEPGTGGSGALSGGVAALTTVSVSGVMATTLPAVFRRWIWARRRWPTSASVTTKLGAQPTTSQSRPEASHRFHS